MHGRILEEYIKPSIVLKLAYVVLYIIVSFPPLVRF
jgi:hypothetical protein